MTLSQTKGRGSKSWTVFSNLATLYPALIRSPASLPPVEVPGATEVCRRCPCLIWPVPAVSFCTLGLLTMALIQFMCVWMYVVFLLTFTTSEMIQCCNLNSFKDSVGTEGVVKWEWDRAQDIPAPME